MGERGDKEKYSLGGKINRGVYFYIISGMFGIIFIIVGPFRKNNRKIYYVLPLYLGIGMW